MSTELAKAYVQIIPSAVGIKGKLQSELGGAGEAAGHSSGSRLVGAIKGAIAVAGIGQIVGKAFTEGADLQQSIGGIETLFKDSSDTVIAAAQNAYKTAGMSANEYMETVTSFSASLLQGLDGDTQKAAASADMALTDMSDNANKMGTSMELIQNAYQGFAKQNYTMLDNLKLGYGGTKTEMERLLADAEKFSGVKYDIDNLNDVYSAIHVVQEEMGITGTTAKEAATTFSGSMASMKSAFSNVLANLTLGEDIGPSLSALGDTVFTFITGNLVPMAANLLSALPEVLSGALSMAVSGINMIADNADEIVQFGIDLITGLAEAIVSAAPFLLEAGANLLAALFEILVTTDWIGVATDLVSGLSESLQTSAGEIFGEDTSLIDGILNSISTNLPSVLEQGVEVITNLANGILQNYPTIITTAYDILTTFVGFIMDNLPMILEAGIELLLNLVNGIIQNLPAIVSAAVSAVGSLLSTILEKAPDLIEGGLTLIGELLAGIISAVPDLIAQIPEIITSIKTEFDDFDWLEIGGNIISGIANGLMNGLSAVVDAAKDVAQSAFDAAKELLGIHSPSTLFEWLGVQTDAGLVKGLKKDIGLIECAMNDVTQAMVQSYTPDISANDLARYETKENWVKNNDTALNRQMLNAILKLANRPVLAHFNVDGHTLSKTIAKPVSEEIQLLNKLENMLIGVR